MKYLQVLLVVLAPTIAFAQNCQCGYRDSNGNVWREAIVSTFTQAAGALPAVNANWIIDTERLPQDSNPHATASIQYTAANVFQHNDALGLKVSAYTGGDAKCAQIFTKRSDIKYGTFRMRAQVPSVAGVVFGFFTYISATQEQDIEFLSADTNYYQRVHYTNQPGTTPGATLDTVIPGADFTTFGNHQIDWLPTRTVYSYDGSGLRSNRTLTIQVPNTPSEFILNVWTNGDPTWSRGPPTGQDAIATVQWVHLYFNSTTLSESAFNTACVNAGRPAVCSV